MVLTARPLKHISCGPRPSLAQPAGSVMDPLCGPQPCGRLDLSPGLSLPVLPLGWPFFLSFCRALWECGVWGNTLLLQEQRQPGLRTGTFQRALNDHPGHLKRLFL